jgi:hypothetical protein
MEIAIEKTVETKVYDELKRIASTHGGMLNPPDVVEFARNPRTELHSKFQWDDTKAATEYRLWQARDLILRVRVDLTDPSGETTEVRAFVSLGSDRGEGGYRAIVDVMSQENLRLELLDEAKRDMKRFRDKYKTLSELSDVFAAMAKV